MRFIYAATLGAILITSPLLTFAQSLEEKLIANQIDFSPTMLEELRSLAEEDHASMQFHLGNMYALAQDYSKAAEWYRKSAEQGFSEAQNKLCIGYANGLGVTQNDLEALDWCRKASVQGEGESLYLLSFIYLFGRGVEEDVVIAYMLANLSATQGDEAPASLRDTIRDSLTPEQISEGQQLASEWSVGTPLPTQTRTWP